jgi:hypothetical protein
MQRQCRHCGGPVPHDAPSAVCGQCACLPVAERGRGYVPPPIGCGHVPELEPMAPIAAAPIRPDRTTDCPPLPRDTDPLAAIRRGLLSRPFPAWALMPQPR